MKQHMILGRSALWPFLLFMSALFLMPLAAENKPNGFSQVYDSYRDVLVSIENPSTSDPAKKNIGCGIILSEAGYILASNKSVEKIDRVTVSNRHQNYYYPAVVVGRDTKHDLALLKVKCKQPLSFAIFERGRSYKAGQMLLMLSDRVESSLLSALVVSEEAAQIRLDRESACPGSALVDTDGRLVGIISGKFSAKRTAVSLRSTELVAAAEALMYEDRVISAYFGMTADNLDPSLYGFYGIRRGILVTTVEANASAEQAGLMRGDLIVGVGSENVTDKAGFAKTVAGYERDDNVTIRYVRHGLNKSLQMRLSKINQELLNPNAFWYKGMVLEPLTPQWRGIYNIPDYLKGVVVTLIEPASAAQEGGMRQGDVIYQLESKSVGDLPEFKALVNIKKKERMFIYRDGWNFIKLF